MKILLGAIAVCVLMPEWIPPAEAVTVVIRSRNPPQISLRVGRRGNRISRVNFNVPVAIVGDSTPIAGNRRIIIRLRARAAPPNSRTATLTVDSSNDLVAPVPGSPTIPFSTISWTAQDGDIPSNTFNSTNSQFLMSFMNSRRVSDRHTYSYDNTVVEAAGRYRGTVTYTLSMP